MPKNLLKKFITVADLRTQVRLRCQLAVLPCLHILACDAVALPRWFSA